MSSGSHPDPSLRATVARAALFAYKALVSPMLHAFAGSPNACRFQPTCSEYAALAMHRHGIVRGTWLAFRRIAKCHPFHQPAFDPVPASRPAKSPPMQSSPPPVTIEETTSAASTAPRPLAAHLPYEPR